MTPIFFDSWQGVLRTLLIGMISYVMLVILLRISGKRTLSKLNAFDFIVTVALGSTLATVLLSKQVPLLEGALGMGLLIAMQYIVTWFSVRMAWLRQLVREEPSLLVEHGVMRDSTLREQRVTRGEVLAAVRAAGMGRIEDVAAVVLETDGSLSVISEPTTGPITTICDVAGAKQ